MAKVFDSLGEFDPSRGSIDAWLTGFARNVARTWWRGAYSRRSSETPLESVPEAVEPEPVDLSASGVLEAALEDLSDLDKELLQLRFGHGYSFEEAASAVGLTPVNARKRVSRAMEALRRNRELRQELGFVN